MRKRAEAYTADDFVTALNDGQTFACVVKDESGDILARHDRELLLEQTFKVDQKDA